MRVLGESGLGGKEVRHKINSLIIHFAITEKLNEWEVCYTSESIKHYRGVPSQGLQVSKCNRCTIVRMASILKAPDPGVTGFPFILRVCKLWNFLPNCENPEQQQLLGVCGVADWTEGEAIINRWIDKMCLQWLNVACWQNQHLQKVTEIVGAWWRGSAEWCGGSWEYEQAELWLEDMEPKLVHWCVGIW